MTSELALLKNELRTQLRIRLKDFPPLRREEVSAKARALLLQQPAWREAKAVLFYAPMPDEIDLLPLLQHGLAEGKKIALPGFVPETGVYAAFQISDFARDCARGRFGILEPGSHCPAISLNALELALVPGIGFDLAGHRLGRGRGYYDRMLEGILGTRCGVAFDEQIVQKIPAEPHDMHMNCILTPTQWLETSGNRLLLS